MKLARAALGAVLLSTAAGCGDDPRLVIAIAHPTLIEVSPAEFLGSVPCLDADGAMRRYVATVFDVTPADDGEGGAGGADPGEAENFQLPSSGPTPCTAPVATAFVVAGRRYSAEIDGYERDDIQPLAAGSRIMLDRRSGEVVEPRWTTRCGAGPGESVMAVAQTTRAISHCAPLEDRRPSQAEPAVVVGIDGALGELGCGSEPGEVAHFEVLDPKSGTSAGAACGKTATLAGVTAGAVLELELSAFEEGKTSPSWGTLCSATPIAGVTVRALCQPLSSEGALDIDLPKALTSVSLGCDERLREVVADPGGDLPAKRVTPPGCNGRLRLSDLPPGQATVALSTILSDGSAGPTLTCGGTVLPGLTTPAACSAN